MILALLSNLALLLSASVLYSYINRLISENTIAGKIIIGISFGVITIVGMTFPYQFANGLIFDGRSVIISVAALFSGPLASLFVVIVSSAYRIWLGGVGLFMGVLVIISSAVIGLLFRYFIKNYNLKLNVIILLLMGLLVHVVMLVLVFTLPSDVAFTVSKEISIPILIIFSLSTVLLGYLILDQEERRETITKLIESEKRWQYALEGPGDGVWDWDMQTNKVLFSAQWKAMLGYDDNEIKNNFDEWEKRVHPDDKQKVYDDLHKHFNGETHYYSNEHRLLCKDGSYKWILDRGKVIKWGKDGKPHRIIGTHTDISIRKQAEEELKKSKSRYSNLFQNMLDGFALHEMIFDDNGKPIDYRFLEINPSFEKMTGLNADDILGKTVLEVMPNTEQYWIDSYGKVVTTGNPIRINNYAKELDKYFEVVAFSPAVNQFATIFTDITERIVAEEALKRSEDELRSLAGYLQTVREKERAAIAREIHDELGQVLTTLKMNISLISREIYDSEKIDKNYLNNEFSSMIKIIDDSVIRVRKLISELRPEVLDKLGLLPALEWQVEEFAKRSGIKCSFKCNVEELDIMPEKGIVVFRVLQEALSNVGRHSNANEANIVLTVDNKNVTMLIIDNGKGYSKSEAESKKTFGLLGMRERAGLINAQFDIKGSPNGTTITLSIPIDKNDYTSNEKSY